MVPLMDEDFTIDLSKVHSLLINFTTFNDTEEEKYSGVMTNTMFTWVIFPWMIILRRHFFFRFTLPYMNRYWMTCYTWGRNDHIFYWTSLIRRLFHHLKHSTVMKLDGFTLYVFPDTSPWSVS